MHKDKKSPFNGVTIYNSLEDGCCKARLESVDGLHSLKV